MNQLAINDLDIAPTNLSFSKNVNGGDKVSIRVGVSSQVIAEFPNGLGAGFGVGAAIAVGNNAQTFVLTGTLVSV